VDTLPPTLRGKGGMTGKGKRTEECVSAWFGGGRREGVDGRNGMEVAVRAFIEMNRLMWSIMVNDLFSLNDSAGSAFCRS